MDDQSKKITKQEFIEMLRRVQSEQTEEWKAERIHKVFNRKQIGMIIGEIADRAELIDKI